MFDPFKQAKLQNGYQAIKQYQPAPEKDMSLDELKRYCIVATKARPLDIK